MAKRYGITRREFFDIVWNINPKKIIRNSKFQVKAIRDIAKQYKKLFLLTGAPRVWMENVLGFLKLEDLFERKYHGEMFEKKDEIFKTLANEFDPKTILSVGDQFETDLKPAQELGIKTLLVQKPEDLLKLI